MQFSILIISICSQGADGFGPGRGFGRGMGGRMGGCGFGDSLLPFLASLFFIMVGGGSWWVGS